MPEKNNMNKKRILITGATAGIGETAARILATQGHEIIIVGRNPQKTESVTERIRAQTGNENVQYLLADFSDLQQIRQLAREVKTNFPKLDVLVNNAGSYFGKREKTKYSAEKTFVVNHLASFLLTNLLLDHLQEHARIINISSNAHYGGRLDLNDLNLSQFYFGLTAYQRSKLANVLFTYELARRLSNTTITVNVLHPGLIATDIFRRNYGILGPFIKWIVSLRSITPEEGADNMVFLTTSADVEGVTGKYFIKHSTVKSAPLSYDETLAKQLWEVSERLTAIP
jgi:NAD(P)-dependent dehydrogenase (short-subunit alcohol dehydrogenase family)